MQLKVAVVSMAEVMVTPLSRWGEAWTGWGASSKEHKELAALESRRAKAWAHVWIVGERGILFGHMRSSSTVMQDERNCWFRGAVVMPSPEMATTLSVVTMLISLGVSVLSSATMGASVMPMTSTDSVDKGMRKDILYSAVVELWLSTVGILTRSAGSEKGQSNLLRFAMLCARRRILARSSYCTSFMSNMLREAASIWSIAASRVWMYDWIWNSVRVSASIILLTCAASCWMSFN